MKKDYCDNTSCPKGNKKQKLSKVKMKKEFEGGTFYWCEECIKRDKDMIVLKGEDCQGNLYF